MSLTQAFQMKRFMHFLRTDTLSLNFPVRKDSILCHTTSIPLSYHCRIIFVYNSNYIRQWYDNGTIEVKLNQIAILSQ